MSQSSNAPPNAAPPTYAEIARRAYEIYVAEGRPVGQAAEHWLMAESALRAERRSTVAEMGQQDHPSQRRRKSK